MGEIPSLELSIASSYTLAEYFSISGGSIGANKQNRSKGGSAAQRRCCIAP
jgi:hypothetical protein